MLVGTRFSWAAASGSMAALASDQEIEAISDGILTRLVPKRPIQFDAIALLGRN